LVQTSLSYDQSSRLAESLQENGHHRVTNGRRLSAGVVALALGVAAAATSGAIALAPVSASSTLVIADLAPFTGPDAALGGYYDASCLAATKAINADGGVLGHQLSCATFDTRGDPADAVPAANQMFATEPNLAMVIGCTSDEAASVVPIINSKQMVMFCMTGQSEFDHVHYPYFFRLVPPDLAESYAMVAIAKYDKHYKKIALAFGNDIGSQTFVQPAITAIKKAGLKLSANVTLDLTANTFRTEAEQVVQSHPDVILNDPASMPLRDGKERSLTLPLSASSMGDPEAAQRPCPRSPGARPNAPRLGSRRDLRRPAARGHHRPDRLGEGQRGIRVQFERDSGSGPQGRVEEVQVEGVVSGRVDGVVEIDTGIGHREPSLSALATASEVECLGLIGAHLSWLPGRDCG